jgi:hypothetical protein
MSNNVTNMFPENYVSLISKDRIHLENVTKNVVKALEAIDAKMGERETKPIWEVAYLNKPELAKKLEELNKLGFLFAGGPHGWPPAEIAADLREKKMLTGSFKEVRWRGPDDCFVVER